MKIISNYFLTILILCFTFETRIHTQAFDNSISGRIIDDENGEALQYVNIYITGTTWGTVSNENGTFEIRSVYPAEHEVVISLIGYEIVRKTVEIGKKDHIKLKDIRLKPKEYEITGLEIVAEKPDRWLRDLRQFKNLFLGTSIFSMDCELKNENYIEFGRPSETVLTAKINRPLQIVNKALGFEIYCDLINFKYDESESRLQYMITTSFKEMIPLDESQKKRWEENRRKAYKESIDHFLVALINNSFMEKGFEVSTSRIPNRNGLDGYRQKIFASDSLLLADSLANEFTLKFPYFLQVVYKKSEFMVNPISWIRILGREAVLDEFGYPKSIVPFETHGHWSQLGVANMLPKYYFGVER
ncbi:MAG: carboxypeptidase-like regulatory domain-containing protein [bacterium]